MKTLLCLILISCFVGNISAQTNYFVSPTGNNSNTGSVSSPWLTISFGLTQLTANDTLNVSNGVYSEKINIPISSIYLRNVAGSTPILDATNNTSQVPIIAVSNKNNVTISGFELRNNIQADAQGILIDGSGSNITIDNCIIHDIHFSANPNAPVDATTNAQGIIVYGSDPATPISNLTLKNNKLFNCRLGYSEGIAVNGNVDGFLVSQNTVYNLTNIGIDLVGHEGTCSSPLLDQARNGIVTRNIIYNCVSPYATSGGIYIDGGKDILVEYNTSYLNGYGIEIGCENVGKTTDGIEVRNNLFYNNEVSGLALGGFDYPSGSGKVTQTIVRNNSFYSNDYSNSGNGEVYLSYSENATIENNVFYTSVANRFAYAEMTQPGLNFDYNVFYCPDGASFFEADWNAAGYTSYSSFVSGSNTNNNSVFGNPLFAGTNPANPNLHLSSSSPCIDAGNPSFIPVLNELDIDNEPRVFNRVDCGADEFYGNTGLSDHDNLTALSIYPNPLKDEAILTSNESLAFANITIFNSSGQIIQSFQNTENSYVSIKREKMETGTYFVTIRQQSREPKTLILIVQD